MPFVFWVLYGIIWYFFWPPSDLESLILLPQQNPSYPPCFIFGRQSTLLIGGEGFDEDLTGVTGSDFDGGAGNGEAAAKMTVECVIRVGESGWFRQERRQWRSWER